MNKLCITLWSEIHKVQLINFILLWFRFQSKWARLVCDPDGYYQPGHDLDAKLKKCPNNDVCFYKLHTRRSILINSTLSLFFKSEIRALCGMETSTF